MSRNGKIARLPRHIREKLNRRLEDGEGGGLLLQWLNDLPEAKDIMNRQFGGRPINKQSLSQWRLGGYQEWLRHQESCEVVRQLAEQAEDLNAEADEQSVSEMLSGLVLAELARVTRAMLAEPADSKERWRQVQELLAQLSRLRRADHRAARLRMDEERWEMERERLEREEWARRAQKAKDKALAPLWGALKRGPLAEAFGGGEVGREIADLITSIQGMDLPESWEQRIRGGTLPDPVRVGQSGSDQKNGT
jgi:hypothetical protein